VHNTFITMVRQVTVPQLWSFNEVDLMYKHNRMWVALLALLLGGASALVYAKSYAGLRQPPTATGFICPITGEELPCERCCPLKQGKQGNLASAEAKGHWTQAANADGYLCPITGEELRCPLCCPLESGK
jgi:hypothetical protein